MYVCMHVCIYVCMYVCSTVLGKGCTPLSLLPSPPHPSPQVSFERKLEGGSATKQVQRTLFGPNNPYPQKKVMTFNKMTHDFTFRVGYTGLDQLGEEERRWAGCDWSS